MTSDLERIESVTQVSPSVIRILGGNPGKFTLQGTNTYLVAGRTDSQEASADVEGYHPYMLIDTGEGKESYIESLRAVLQGQNSQTGSLKRSVSDIILTHWHQDHIGGLPSVLHLLQQLKRPPPRIHKFLDGKTDDKVIQLLDKVPSGQYQRHSPTFALHSLVDGQNVQCASAAPDGREDEQSLSTLRVIHTPGHTTDHVCLLLRKEGILFTADHVLGQGTSVFEDLGIYLRSLMRCKQLLNDEISADQGPFARHLFPAHGPIVASGLATLQQYIDHRLERERQVLHLLAETPPTSSDASSSHTWLGGGIRDGAWTIPALVSSMYRDYPESVYPAAARGIFLHLRKLALPDDGRVRCSNVVPDVPQEDAGWQEVMNFGWSLLPGSMTSKV